MKKAYSYIRYSSPQQAKGDSFRRQLATTQSFCEKNGYELDTELSVYQELGVSGFSGDQENLKRFINDCEIGKVEKGSLLGSGLNLLLCMNISSKFDFIN